MKLLTLAIALCVLGLEVENRLSFERRVLRIVEQRERDYSAKLVTKMNRGRELMGLPLANPNNFAEVLESYFASMAAVMDQGVSNSIGAKATKDGK